jgi:hypothetical protein
VELLHKYARYCRWCTPSRPRWRGPQVVSSPFPLDTLSNYFCFLPESELTLTCVRRNQSGGILVVRAKEEQAAEFVAAELNNIRLADKLSKTSETGAVSSFIDLIPSLSLFLDLADTFSSVCCNQHHGLPTDHLASYIPMST